MLIALERAGSLPKMRLTGMLVGMKEVFPQLENCKRDLPRRRRKVRRQLRSDAPAPAATKSRRFLVGAINDPERARRAARVPGGRPHRRCAIMGQNASPEGRAELREPGTRLIGSVAYFPEKYGAEIVAVALDILHRRPCRPAVFVKHQLVTPENGEPHLSERSADAIGSDDPAASPHGTVDLEHGMAVATEPRSALSGQPLPFP